MVFFHFGHSKDPHGSDHFIYLGHKSKACLSGGLLRRLPKRQLETINAGRASWFVFNQEYEWFCAFRRPGTPLGAGSVDCSRLPARIESFLSDATRSHVGPRAVFGPNGSVLCWSGRSNRRMGRPRTAARWNADQKARMEKMLLNPWTGSADVGIRFAALGTRGAYFIKFDDQVGSVKCDLRGCYPALAKYLDRIGRRSVQFLALHPQDPDQYFLVDNNGNIRARLSAQIERQLRSTLQDEQFYTKNIQIVVEIVETRRPLKSPKSESLLVVREVEIDRLSIG